MIKIQNHTIEETTIDKNGWILDLGCINFAIIGTIVSMIVMKSIVGLID